MGKISESEINQIKNFINRETYNVSRLVKAKEIGFSGESNWGGVKGHCLIEAARVCILADLLGLGNETKKKLVLAALLHDGHKKEEIEAIQEEIKNGGSGRVASILATERYLIRLSKNGVPKEVISLIGFAGGMPEVVFAVEKIINKENITNSDLAKIVLHYVDAYTRNDEWVEPAEAGINDIDRRAEKNRQNHNYQKITDEISAIFASRDFFPKLDSLAVMALVNHMIEEKISRLISERNGVDVGALFIPEEIDRRLKAQLVH